MFSNCACLRQESYITHYLLCCFNITLTEKGHFMKIHLFHLQNTIYGSDNAIE